MERNHREREKLEIELLLEAIYRYYGYDFRGYAAASLKRRIHNMMRTEQLTTVSGLQERILHDDECMARFLTSLSVNVTAVFRDPEFFQTFRSKVVPHLRTYPFLRIWHAGCSSGEEVYSMAILLQEEGLYDRCRIYATDMDELVLKRAKEGIFSLDAVKQYSGNYRSAGGTGALSDYYTGAYGHGLFRPSLRENILFSQHNLAMDSSFNEFHVILCRNVMIYFDKSTQQQLVERYWALLRPGGHLFVGHSESLTGLNHKFRYVMPAVYVK